ncbi:ring-cleaving dioxygenase [Bacillus massiliglaciei]|uniref:ring-cleaving dioxygenase n=1 Tax=Bacillus massiliglaciei TaxID=1816693 RepID=UPI000AB16E39|nr:ring-cleaving dioxygenase [Bacillus massiliglaciei]
MQTTQGIHHISAMVNDAQRTIDFYSGVLGLSLVKKTVNYDRPEVYHLYFGNESGRPGTVITFFPWPKQLKGRIGTGQVGTVSYLVPAGSMEFWKSRLQQFGIEYVTALRFEDRTLTFQDPDGLELQIIERQEGPVNEQTFGGIQTKHAIIGFGGVTLLSAHPNKTADVLEHVLGMKCAGDEEGFLRFKSESQLGNMIDIKLSPSVRGLMGAGTIHHIAWRARDEEELLRCKSVLEDQGYSPTEVRDRKYFKAVYFHEGGGILFEIATDLPGFTVDEPLDELGEKLMLPSWLESKRDELEASLPSIKAHGQKTLRK